MKVEEELEKELEEMEGRNRQVSLNEMESMQTQWILPSQKEIQQSKRKKRKENCLSKSTKKKRQKSQQKKKKKKEIN